MTRKYIYHKCSIYKKLSTGSFSSSAIDIYNFKNLDVRVNIGKKKDTFGFDIINPKRNNMYETRYSGNGVTAAFTLKYGPIDSDLLSGANQKVFVYVGGTLQSYGTHYTISSSTLTFEAGYIPASGVENILVKFQVLESGDLVRIYQVLNDTSYGNDDILIEGTVETPGSQLAPNTSDVLTIEGNGIIENIFSTLVFIKDEALDTPPKIIQNALTQINNYNRLRKIYGENDTEWGTIGNSTSTSASVPFSSIQYTASYKSALEIIEEVSSDTYTKDGAYYYYINFDSSTSRYNFKWGYKNPSADFTKELIEGQNGIKSIKVYKDNSEVINAIIYNVGLDCYEVPQEFLNYSQTSFTGSGAKWKYILGTNHIISDILTVEFEADTSKFDKSSEGNRISNFPQSSVVTAWTFQFKTREDDGTPSATTSATATSNKTFNDAVVVEAKWRGKDATDRVLKTLGAARIKAEIQMPFTTAYTLGDLLPITSETFGITDYPLRLHEIKYDDNDTTLYLEEDENTAIARVLENG